LFYKRKHDWGFSYKEQSIWQIDSKRFSIAHEYAIFAGKSESVAIGRLSHSEQQAARYKFKDEIGQYEWVNFRKHGGANANRYARPKLFYPIFISENTGVRFPNIEWDQSSGEYKLLENPEGDESIIFPVNPDGEEKTWNGGMKPPSCTLKNLASEKIKKDNLAFIKKHVSMKKEHCRLTVWGQKRVFFN